MSLATSPDRIVSMDQFRGYTVAGMFVVNFLGHFAAIHSILHHNDTYFSYADSILPSFIFAAGFSYRLTVLRRLPQFGAFKTYLTYVRRCLALVLVSLAIYGFGNGFNEWREFSRMPEEMATAESADAPASAQPADSQAASDEDSGPSYKDPAWPKTFFANWFVLGMKLLKAHLWEVLAIIGVTQIFIMPVVSKRPIVKVLAIIACGAGHTAITWWFNWGFVHGYQDNWMVKLWHTGDETSWDGGFFGIMSWAVSMLAGTLAYDIVAEGPPKRAFRRLVLWGAALMVLAYAMSCLSRLYDVEYGAQAGPVKPKSAASPVLPPLENAKNRPWTTLVADPPFVQPPKERKWLQNYWMMGKRVVNLPFILFGSGFAFALYGLFVLACDVGSLRVGVFRTFGTNPLAAYAIHYIIYSQMHHLMPKDSELWFCLVGLVVFFVWTYGFVRHLERQRLYLRL